jgi:hypothetical protein
MNANRGTAGAQLATIKPQDGTILPIGELMERIIAVGDLRALSPEDRAHYLVRLAGSVGLNPMSQPFDLIPGRDGSLKPYLNKGGTDQLRKLYRLRTVLRSAREVAGVYVVEVEVTDGVRSETNIGAVSIDGLRGEPLQNALMKAHTKAKRRATLDWVGLGVLDEAEIEGVRSDYDEQRATVTAEAVREVAPALGDGIPDADFADTNSGELVGQDRAGIRPQAETREQVLADIERYAGELGWTVQDAEQWAFEQTPPINARTKSGVVALRDRLKEMVDAAFSDAYDDAQQGSFVEAESRVAGEPDLDRHSA